MKKVFCVLGCMMFLYSCGGSEKEVVVTGLKTVESKEFSISLPEKWNLIEDFSEFKPSKGELTLIGRASDLKYGFLNSIVVLSVDLPIFLSSKDWSAHNYTETSKEALEFLRLDTVDMNFSDGDITQANIFEARYNITTSVFKFLQFGKVCGTKRGHLITIAVSQDTKNMDPYLEFAKTFTCK